MTAILRPALPSGNDAPLVEIALRFDLQLGSKDFDGFNLKKIRNHSEHGGAGRIFED
jgi:hypothetical protein